MLQNAKPSTQEYLHLLAELVGHCKRRTYELMQVHPGDAVLDVGCGPGIDTLALANLVGPTGRVVGIDAAQAHVDSANAKAGAAGQSCWIAHQVADAYELPFADGEFDAVRSERVFQHLQYNERALAEMVRVAKPGGRIVVLDTDWNTESYDTGSEDPTVYDIERRLVRYRAEHYQVDGSAGRKLWRMFHQQGLADIHLELAPSFLSSYRVAREALFLDELEAAALVASVVTPAEVEHLRHSLEEADNNSCFFVHVGQIMIAGCKP